MLDDNLYKTLTIFLLIPLLNVLLLLSNSQLPLCSRHDIVTILDGRENRTVKTSPTMIPYTAIAATLSSTTIRTLAYVFFRWVITLHASFSCLSTS